MRVPETTRPRRCSRRGLSLHLRRVTGGGHWPLALTPLGRAQTVKKRGPPLRGVGWVGNRPVPSEGQWRAPGSFESVGLGLRHLEHLEPLVDLAIRLVAGDPVPLLDLPDELIAATHDDIHVVVGEPAPLLAGLTLELLPSAFNLVPIHRCLRGAPAGRLV